MYSNISIYSLLTIITNVGKKSFSNMAKKIGVSDKTVSRMLRSGDESLSVCKIIAQYLFASATELKILLDETNIKKIHALLMEGTEYNFDTKTRSCSNAYKMIVSAITDGKYTIPIDAAFTFGKYFYESPSLAREITVQFYIKNAQELFPKVQIIAVLDGAFATVSYIKWAIDNHIKTELRMHSNRKVEFEGKLQALREIKKLRPKGRQMARTISATWKGLPVFITAVRRIDKHGCETIVYQVATYQALPKKHAQVYKERWGIEKFFRTTKQTLGLQECFSRKIKIQFNHVCAVMLAYSIMQLEARRGRFKNPESAARALEKKKDVFVINEMLRLDQIFDGAYA